MANDRNKKVKGLNIQLATTEELKVKRKSRLLLMARTTGHKSISSFIQALASLSSEDAALVSALLKKIFSGNP